MSRQVGRWRFVPFEKPKREVQNADALFLLHRLGISVQGQEPFLQIGLSKRRLKSSIDMSFRDQATSVLIFLRYGSRDVPRVTLFNFAFLLRCQERHWLLFANENPEHLV